MTRIAAIDQGTTSTRCLVVEEGGSASCVAARRHTQYHPAPNHVEHDPEELIANIRAVLAEAGSVDAIAIANQGESCLAWDAETGRALSPVIVWQDARTTDDLKALGPEAEARSKAISGLPLDPYFSASKFRWLLLNNPDVADAHQQGRLRLGTTDAFFLDRLTGHFNTDPATASRTGLLDMATGQWSAELCELHGVPLSCLPEICPVDAGFGTFLDIPVKVSIVDQQAALRGHGCIAHGDCKVTFGTGAFLLAVTGNEPPPHGDLLPTIGWKCEGLDTVYALEGGVYDAGAALEWARNAGLFDSVEELDTFDGPSALSRGLVFVPALSGLAAPHWDRKAAPLFIGMDHATTRLDLVRAVLEGIAMLTIGLIEATETVVGRLSRISIDGGLSQNAYFAQFLASASGRTIVVPTMHELTALGLAAFCGIDVGTIRGQGRIFESDGSVSAAQRTRFEQALGFAKGWRGA
nr:FGGY family carbohydrate kinase [uncultured Cohaesibacter sp.]